MKNKRKRRIALIVTFAVCITSISFTPASKASAATYITVSSFAKALVTEIGLTPISGTESSGYVNALIEKGIIKEGDFTSYSGYLTRTDAAVLLNRADEYLYGDTLDPKLVQTGLEKRISDINKIAKSKRTDVVKCYLKGIIKGYSNGSYSTDREYRGSKKIAKIGALDCLKMLKDKSLRAKISPDCQLIRTTNLPVYAKYYPYILASYPNSYYDWKFYYEGMESKTYNPNTQKWEVVPHINLVDYAAPVDVDKTNYIPDFKSVKEENIDQWVDKAKTHLEAVFSADYRTIGDDWINKVLTTDYRYVSDIQRKYTKDRINNYIKAMKANKTIVEYSKIAVDGSSMYYFEGCYYLRTYVRYRIVLSNTLYGSEEAINSEKPYSNILYSKYPLIGFDNFKLGEWREGHFDIALTAMDDNYLQYFGIVETMLVEHYYSLRRTDR